MQNRAATIASLASIVLCAITSATLGTLAGLTVAFVCLLAIGVVSAVFSSRHAHNSSMSSTPENPALKEASNGRELPGGIETTTGGQSPSCGEPQPQEGDCPPVVVSAVLSGQEQNQVPQQLQASAGEQNLQATEARQNSSDNTHDSVDDNSPTSPPQSERTTISEHKTNKDATVTASFDYEVFQRSLFFSSNPIATLRATVDRIRKRQKQEEHVSDAELFLVRLLEEAGLYTDEGKEELPQIDIVRPHRTGMFYLRTHTNTLPYGIVLRIVSIEAVLNALFFAHEYYGSLDDVSMEDLYRLWQRVQVSLCAQAPAIDTADWSYLAMPWQIPYGPSDQGEWAVRYALSEAIESAQAPYRLEATFRSNVSSGDIALEFLVTPSRAFPHSASVANLGIIPTTINMRCRAASEYAARMGLLLASQAFHTSSRIKRVWIAAIERTPSERNCWYSVCVGRRAFSQVRMGAINNPLATLRSLGASFEECDGVFTPTAPCFYLEDEQFCPHFRHDLWNLSERSLPASAALSLGASRVSGLFIHEELPRSIAADKMLRGIVPSWSEAATQTSVRAVLDAAHETSDMSVWSAAERVASKLVDGRLSTDDPQSIHDEMVSGDDLSKAVETAQDYLFAQRPHEALQVLHSALGPLEQTGRYFDSKSVVYRSFDSFVERVIYNRLNAQDTRTVALAPDAYVLAHLIASAMHLSLANEGDGNVTKAHKHALRALQVAPINGPANLGMVACLEAMGDIEGASKQLKSYLEVAYHPHGIGLAYFKLGSLEWQLANKEACHACLQRAVRLFPPLLSFVMSEFQSFANQDGSATIELLDDDNMERILQNEGIPVAPTPRTSFILYDGATASIDAEVFPVAQDLMRILEILTGDDVIRGIRLSLEREPDA